jgi:hypothetical protein
MFPAYSLLAIAPVSGLGVYCFSHVLLSRTVGNRGHYFPLFLGCLVGLATVFANSVAVLVLMQSGVLDGIALVAMNVVCYLAFSFGYFNFINLNIASLRIRMLQELAESGGEMPVEKLTSLYNTNAMIAVRINRLVSGGHLIEREGCYYSGKQKFLLVGRIFDFLRLVILGSKLPLSSPAPANREPISQRTP